MPTSKILLLLLYCLPVALPATLWIEPENIPLLEHWKISRHHGDEFLCGAEDGLKQEAAARTDTALVRIDESGTYRLWVRSRDFAKSAPATRTFQIALNDVTSAVEFGTHRQDGFQWQSGGEFVLPAGACRLALIDSSSHYAKVEKIMLTTDLALQPSGRGEKQNVAYLKTKSDLPPAPDDGVRLDIDFPGGNLLFDRRVGDTFYIRQDLRDTGTDWFYWSFRIRGAAGKTLTFRFTGTPPIGARGPAVSKDALTWRWLGQAVGGDRFAYSFSGDEDDVYFSFGMTYTRRNLDAFLAKHRVNPALRTSVLAHTKNNAPVPLITLGEDRKDRGVVVITARHHSCEMMASYVVEGFIERFLSDTPDGLWLRNNIDCRIIPLVDTDGVEAGDQGKNREPHDHNRDYAEDKPGLFPEVTAIRQLISSISPERLRALMDIHCPYMAGADHEHIYQTGRNAAQIQFGKILESVDFPSLPYHAPNERPTPSVDGTRSTGTSFGAWASRQAPCLVTTLEVPYANAEGVTVDQESARAFGRRLALALHNYLNPKAGQP